MSKHTQKCCGTVYKKGHNIWTSKRVPCTKNASVERDGKHYCGTHDPVRRSARLDANSKASQDEWERKLAEQRRKNDCESALAGVSDPAAFMAKVREAAMHHSPTAALATLDVVREMLPKETPHAH